MNIITKIKNFIKQKIQNNTFFNTHFGFETGINIENDSEVIYRKNTVIKNIIFVSNIFYTIIFAAISLGEPSDWTNWLLTILLFPITFIVNHFLKQLIKHGPNDTVSQTMATYLACFYMLLSSIIVYTKLKFGNYDTSGNYYLEEVGYILIYYSLIICSLYQDKKLLKNIYIVTVIIVFVLHFFITYNVVLEARDYNDSFINFIIYFLTSNAFRDILLRTMLIIMFVTVLYIQVSMSEYIQNERKSELIKRKMVEDAFKTSITNIFDLTLNKINFTEDEKIENETTSKICLKFANILGLDEEEINELDRLINIWVTEKFDMTIDNNKSSDEQFEILKEKTEIGYLIISRIEINKVANNMIRAQREQTDFSIFKSFIDKCDKHSEMILLSELYVILRSFKSYKRAYNHEKALESLNEFRNYFDISIFDMFVRFGNEFKLIYEEQ